MGHSTGLRSKLVNLWIAGSHLTQAPKPVLILLTGPSLQRTQSLPLVSLIQLKDYNLTVLSPLFPSVILPNSHSIILSGQAQSALLPIILLLAQGFRYPA